MPAAGHRHLVVVVYAHYAVLALQGVGVYVWPLGNGKFAVTPRLRRIFARRAADGAAEQRIYDVDEHESQGGRLYLNLETYADDADADKPFVLRLLVDFVDAGGRRTTPFTAGYAPPRVRLDALSL